MQVAAEVELYSSLPDEMVTAALLRPIRDPSAAVRAALERAGRGATLAVLPEGPYVVPYVAAARALA